VSAYSGLITAKSAGIATIYATAQDGSGVGDCCTVYVKQTVLCSAEETPVNKVQGSTFADPVDVYTGAHLLNNTIMCLFGGQGLKLVAHYDSTQLASGVLGSGWYHNYEKHIEVDGCEAFVYNNPSIFSRYTAESDCCTRFTCCSANKNGYVLTVDHSRQYPYIIDCNSARTEYYNANGDLAKIKDHQGFETLISYSDRLITITDCVSGKKMYLEKDSTCKVVRIYDEANRVAILGYTNNLLTSIKDVNGNLLTYEYDNDKRIISGTDSKGIRYFENTYDAYGRVLTQKDALNHTSYFDYSDNAYECCVGDTRITTNRNGKTSRRVYDCDGL
jgi:YD repeat-containing protein